jgi:hypothetical protein
MAFSRTSIDSKNLSFKIIFNGFLFCLFFIEFYFLASSLFKLKSSLYYIAYSIMIVVITSMAFIIFSYLKVVSDDYARAVVIFLRFSFLTALFVFCIMMAFYLVKRDILYLWNSLFLVALLLVIMSFRFIFRLKFPVSGIDYL